MSLHFFTIRALQPEPEQSTFNAFCAQHRVLRIERHFVAEGLDAFWAVCVEAADGLGPLPEALKRSSDRRLKPGAAAGAPTASTARPDYKQLLPESDFEVFVALRQWRKAQAEAEGVPLYAVFTNEQLAEVARRRCDRLAALAEIEGVGPARVQRYGAAVLEGVARAGAGMPGSGTRAADHVDDEDA